jgi:hypothetical protein
MEAITETVLAEETIGTANGDTQESKDMEQDKTLTSPVSSDPRSHLPP